MQAAPPGAQPRTSVNLWALGVLGYRHVMQPNQWTCIEYRFPTSQIYGVSIGTYSHWVNPPTSLHPGGVNMVFCDGHVEFVNEKIDQQVFRAIGTIRGGEVVEF